MKNELLTIGPFTIYGYGLMIAIGIIFAYYIAENRAEKKNLEKDMILSLVLWCTVGGFLSAKILFWIVEWKEIMRDISFLKDSLTDGFVVYGGIIGGIVAGYLFCYRNNLKFLKYFDLVMPSIALAQGFGRIGCLLAGCCYGKETTGTLAIVFHESDFAPNNISLIPTQIYSSLLDFLHCFILIHISKKECNDGIVAASYLIFYSIGRFILEFYRGDLERGNIGIFSTSQFISIFIMIIGIIMFLQCKYGKYKTERKA